ncbi:hypothetical protein SDA22_00280 [Legionella pneumophila serogroup 1]|uniref:Taurine catabolism dioxygenase TauD, TfdA family n=1 Tax=Legionella waltersii TaxID=66969 RepID=A0A0W1ANR0_9GAMM|nr:MULTISPECIES: hypothetical protein [Legionella]KTD82977.1 Taurine catabolism dioxygenase TauD, TfdA family [Legionella waltersii]QIB23893.1 hypothetical protein GCO85_05645 [Legionella pneumophila]CZG21748.1 Taurine catabolism dioxygenase TauD%2C TfdA family [Legionella pneumophila]SNV07448.1 Taurine catabolism dioxygenase TauD, TfdA family [Legionella waltersii]HAU2287740.1 hypothetical protein [Legionella pneumophila]
MINLKKLEEQGWIEIEGISSLNDLLLIARNLGIIQHHPNGEIVSSLIPSDGKNSIKGTLSNIYGFSEFPLHTDTAFWPIPARYVVMGMFNKSNCSTSILNLTDFFSEPNQQALRKAQNSIYLIKTIEGKRYTSFYFKNGSKDGFRFDTNCMIPVNNESKIFHTELIKWLIKQKRSTINWSGNKAIILDNWKILHGRGAIPYSERNRKLMRIYVG